MNNEFDKAYKFLFEETYRMWKSDMEKIFRIGTRGQGGGCNLSLCILVLIGIESFSKFFSIEKEDVDQFTDFVDTYYPVEYKGKMKKIYKLFRHGLVHYFYPKSEIDLMNSAKISVGVDDRHRVVSLSRLRGHINEYRRQGLELSPAAGKPYVIVPQVVFLDTVMVMEHLKEAVNSNDLIREHFIKNHDRIRKKLHHSS